MSKCKTSSKHLYSSDDKIQSMDKTDKLNCSDKNRVLYTKLNHSDVITIDKMKYVKDEALYCGPNASTEIIINKHLSNIAYYECLGEYSINQDKICLLSDGFDYWLEINKTPIEEQVARTISHEIMHRILFYEQGEDACRAFDNIAESLRQYWMW